MQNGKCLNFSGTGKQLSRLAAGPIYSMYIKYFLICVRDSILSSPLPPFFCFFTKKANLVHFNFGDRNTAKPLALVYGYMFVVLEQCLSAVALFSKYLKTPNPIKNKKEAIEKRAECHEFQRNTGVACNKQQNITRVMLTLEHNCHSGSEEQFNKSSTVFDSSYYQCFKEIYQKLLNGQLLE